MRPPLLVLALAPLALAACAARVPAPADAEERARFEQAGTPRLAIEYPPDGATLGGPQSLFLAGRVAAGIERGEKLDLVLAIDTSGSTCAAPARAGAPRSETCVPAGPGTGDAPGRVIDVEIAAARALLERLDPELTRVGVVSFGAGTNVTRALHRFQGPDTGFLGTLLELAPTADFAAVSAALDAVAARTPDGPTNLAGALGRSTLALAQLSAPAPRRVIVLLTDGIPTAPRETDRENLVEALRAAARTAHHHARVLSFAIGEAAEQPVAALEIAERTGGAFYPVRDPADLPSVFRYVQLDQIAALDVRNATTGDAARGARLAPDGAFDAVVPLAPGANTIEVRTRSESGVETVRDVAVVYAPGDAAPVLPPGLAARRETARRAELELLARAGDSLEREAAERTRERLARDIARERAAAAHATASQRRELALEVEPPDVGAAPPAQ